jgi:hypothetical protein
MTVTVEKYDSRILPPGEYFIGDPCYVIPDTENQKLWQESCSVSDLNSEGLFVIFDGVPWIGLSTAFGDGVYNSNIHTSYSVDSGLIGAVPRSIVDKYSHRSIEELESLGSFQYFEKPFSVESDEGTLRIGDIKIETNL